MTTLTAAAQAVRDRLPKWCDPHLLAPSHYTAFADALGIRRFLWDDENVGIRHATSEVRGRVLSWFDGVDERTVIVIVLPEETTSRDETMARVCYSRVVVAVADGLAHTLACGGRLIVISGDSIKGALPEAFEPTPQELAARGDTVHRLLRRARRVELDDGVRRFPVRGAAWELETTNLARERIIQLPGGEVFAHFACDWEGSMAVANIGEDGWLPLILRLRRGAVAGVHAPDGTPVMSRFLGRAVSEIGIGTNPGVALQPSPWAEKAEGVLHIGLGQRLGADIAPPSVHSDAIAKNAMLIVDGEDFSL